MCKLQVLVLLVGIFNQEKALVGAFSMIVKSTRILVWSSRRLRVSPGPSAEVTAGRRAECRVSGPRRVERGHRSRQSARGAGTRGSPALWWQATYRNIYILHSDQTSLINIPYWIRCRRVLSAQSAILITTNVLKVTKYIYNFPVTMVSRTLLILLLCHWKNTSAGNKDNTNIYTVADKRGRGRTQNQLREIFINYVWRGLISRKALERLADEIIFANISIPNLERNGKL